MLILTFVAYSSAIHGGFIWDDNNYGTANSLLTAPNGLWRIWTTTESPQFYPLVFTTFWVERRLWGLQPSGYHIVNVILHCECRISLATASANEYTRSLDDRCGLCRPSGACGVRRMDH